MTHNRTNLNDPTSHGNLDVCVLSQHAPSSRNTQGHDGHNRLRVMKAFGSVMETRDHYGKQETTGDRWGQCMASVPDADPPGPERHTYGMRLGGVSRF